MADGKCWFALSGLDVQKKSLLSTAVSTGERNILAKQLGRGLEASPLSCRPLLAVLLHPVARLSPNFRHFGSSRLLVTHQGPGWHPQRASS